MPTCGSPVPSLGNPCMPIEPMLRWLRRGLAIYMRSRVTREALGLIIEDGYEFTKTRQCIIENDIEDDIKTWCWAPLNADALQLLPIDIKSISHPTAVKCSIFRDSYYPAGKAHLPAMIDNHPYVRNGASTVRILVFGTRPENMMVISVTTNRMKGFNGRVHKAYLNNKSWITYGISLQSPTMGFKLPSSY